jgi:TonB family protein
MPAPLPTRAALAALGLALGAGTTTAVHAQPVPDRTVRGAVTTADGTPIVNAALYLVDTLVGGDGVLAASTGADGRYRFSLPVRPTSALVVRRLGLRQRRVAVGPERKKRASDLAAIALEWAAPPAATVAVRDTGAYGGPNAPFFRHLASGRGRYVTPAQLARIEPSRTSQILRMLPGVNLVPMASGGFAVRGPGRSCYASLWIDNAPFGARPFDVDNIPANSLLGVEFYTVGTTMPMEYQTTETASCGALLLWTQRGGLDDEAEAGSVADPANVRLASDVDAPARLVDSTAFAPRYPDLARSAGIGGPVVVELVVDTLGQIERSSLGVVATAAPQLADATVRAASHLRFTPATSKGRPVRQLVHLVARYEPPRDASGRPRSVP